MAFGIFMGYRIAPGGRWNGEYLCMDIDEFVGKSLDVEAHHSTFSKQGPSTGRCHVTKKIALSDKGIHFPLKERYDWYNTTLEGREKHFDIMPEI